MARGRPRLSPEAKAAKKERAAADKASALAANALAKLPAEKEARDELWRELDGLIAEGQGVAGQISQQKKRMTDVFGITKEAMQIRKILNKCRDGVYEATVEQVQLFMQDTNRPIQLSMKLEPGKGVAEDQGSVFDASHSGETVGAERGDDPGRAQRRKGPPAPPYSTTPDVGAEGLAAGIKPLETPEEKRARIDAQKADDASVFDKDDAKSAAKEAMRKKADKYFEPQGTKGLGGDAVH